ncbi:hypothetical protein R6Q59_036134 [Mikania micrantha]
MASSSPSFHSAPSSSSQSCKYDVFLSFRGKDTRKTFVDHLHSTLKQHPIHVYKDDTTLPRGEIINQSLIEAIEESRIAIIIFSKNYAGSSWCLDELTHIMKCNNERDLIVLPIFYDVEPTEVRKQTGEFGEAFAKQEARNGTKVEKWRKTLVDESNISGWELKNTANGHESPFIEKVVNAVLDRLFLLNSCVDEDLVGMRTRHHELELLLDVNSVGVRMVGIWGVGGSGKTTLATSLYMKISQHFQNHCFVEDIREERSKHRLNKLQEDMLSALFKNEAKIPSVVEGKNRIKDMSSRSKVLLILDDVDKLDQLEALAGKHNWFGSGSRIIITTRDEHLLRTHKVDHVYPIRLLTDDEAVQVFKIHAYNEEDPLEDYETLSLRVISYASGLPLALKVIGSFLYDKKKNEWISALDKLKETPDPTVMDILKLSFDGLEAYQKDLFLDIACFWRFYSPDDAMEIFEACGYHPEIGIKVLRQKALITIGKKEWGGNKFDMHFLVQEMGHYIVRGEHPKNPRKHSRVWKDEEIEAMCFGDATTENYKTEALTYFANFHNDISSRICEIISRMKKLRWIDVNFSTYFIKDVNGDGRPTIFSDSFHPIELCYLKLEYGVQKELWKGCKHLPHLKVLHLQGMKKLKSTPNFNGLPHLQKLTLEGCYELEEIHPSFGSHKSLKYLNISNCPKLRMFPTIVHMRNLKTLTQRECHELEEMHPSFGSQTSLEYLNISACRKLRMFPTVVPMRNLKTLKIKGCSLKDGEIPFGIGELSNLKELDLSGNAFSLLDFSISQLPCLKVLKLSKCFMLNELPDLPSSLVFLNANQWMPFTTNLANDGERILQSMLEGEAIANGSLILLLLGLQIPMGFTPPLLRSKRYTLQIPENWRDDFSGFLMCAVLNDFIISRDDFKIIVKQASSGVSFEDDLVWEDSDGKGNTLVWYVSFDLLRDTAWWNQTYKSLYFEITIGKCSGFGVKLVEKKNRSGLMETSKKNSYDHTPLFKIEYDKASDAIMISSLVHYYD